jgi:GntR family transcriptional regulator of arabinose operon
MHKSLSDKIAELIAAEFIDSGLLRPHDRLPTVQELRDKYNVSGSTIAHALGLLVQQGRVEKGKGGACYISIYSPVSSQKLFGFVMPTISALGLETNILQGVERACKQHGYYLLTAIASPIHDYDGERRQVMRLIEAGCQAIAIFPVVRTREQLERDYLNEEFLDLPIVLIDMAYPEQKRSQVILDNYTAGYEMTQALIQEGHRRIAIAVMPTTEHESELMHRSNRDRLQGYMAACKSAGIAVDSQDAWTISFNNPMRDMAGHVLNWYKQSDRPTALIAMEDWTAMHAISVAKDLGIRVPNDLRVVGFDNRASVTSFSPLFPTTTPDFAKSGELAVSLAIRQIDETLVPPVTYLLPAPIWWQDGIRDYGETATIPQISQESKRR